MINATGKQWQWQCRRRGRSPLFDEMRVLFVSEFGEGESGRERDFLLLADDAWDLGPGMGPGTWVLTLLTRCLPAFVSRFLFPLPLPRTERIGEKCTTANGQACQGLPGEHRPTGPETLAAHNIGPLGPGMPGGRVCSRQNAGLVQSRRRQSSPRRRLGFSPT